MLRKLIEQIDFERDRSIYTHELRWEPMQELVRGLDESLRMFEDEIAAFSKEIRK